MNDQTNPGVPPLPRLATGSDELDAILDGGFPANSINILMGEPGSGKTILAEQIMFANAERGGRPILFLTTMSEPLDKVVRYLQQFSFYDEEMLAGAIAYESLGEDLAAHGVAAVVPRVKGIITASKPKIIVIDSFKAIHDLSTSVAEMRRMLHELGGLLTAYETTAFLVGEYGAEDVARYPEFAVADGMIQLERAKLGTRDERFLRVLKLRGSNYAEGLHGFRLTKDGIEIFPRLVSPETAPSYEILSERVPTGCAGLDTMLGGGLLRGRSTFLLGRTGSGKTTLAQQFALEGNRRGEQTLYVSLEENPTQFDAQLRSMGSDPEHARATGFHYLYVSPVELRIDSIVAQIFRTIQEHGIRRVVVDAVGDLVVAANDVQRLHSYLYALAQHFAVMGVTSMFPSETPEGYEAASLDARLSALADNILLLGVEITDGEARRYLRIVKARAIAHDLDVRTIQITGQGIEVK